MTSYWESRKGMNYLSVAIDHVRRQAAGGTLLDVGGGTQKGCDYLNRLPEFDRTVIEKEADAGLRLPGVRFVFSDFLSWEPDQTYDVGLCLQVMEHVSDPEQFVARLMAYSKALVVSCPYLWPAGRCKHHLHDPIDDNTLFRWFRRRPVHREVVRDGRSDRLVATFFGW